MDFADREGYIWLDGEYVDWRKATIHVLSHSLHYGTAVFEGIRAYKTQEGPVAVFRLPEHIDRFFDSAKILRMSMPFSKETLLDVAQQLIKKNKLHNGAYLRPLCFYGAESMGVHSGQLSSHVMMAAWEWGAYLGKDALEKGIRVKVSSFCRFHPNSLMTKAKASGHYINSKLAKQEVQSAGYDEALLLDSHGMVAEGSGENIFIVKNDQVFTPPLTDSLRGITRDSAWKLLEDAGHTVVERVLTRDEVYLADEAFFTGTAAEITPIRECDDIMIGNGQPGPVTQSLQHRFFDVVRGQDSAYQKWLTVI